MAFLPVSDMRMVNHWRFVLPSVGLMLFTLVSWTSFSWQHDNPHPGRYFWWSSIRLDTDPAGRRFKTPPPCTGIDEPCWDPIYLWRSLDWPATLLMVSAFPAFYAVICLARLLGRAAISEVTTFMFVMPLLLFVWYYWLGWWIDRRRAKKHAPASLNSYSGSNR